MSRDLNELTADTREAVDRLLSKARELGLTVRVDSTRRTCAEQAAEYAKGRTVPGDIVTQVSGCRSFHVMGRAVDIFVGTWDCADYEELGKFWESIGGRWGGRFSFRDCVHFEWPHPLMSLEQLCPAGVDCESAVQGQPPALTMQTLAIFGAAVGMALAVTLAGARTR